MFDAAEEAFDQVAVFVQMLIELTLNEAMTSWRDDSLNVVGGEVFENGVGVVGLISRYLRMNSGNWPFRRSGLPMGQPRRALNVIASLLPSLFGTARMKAV